MYGLIFDFNFEFYFFWGGGGGELCGWVNIPLILKVTVVI